MPTNPTFSKFKSAGNISVSAPRRVGHSLTQKLQSLTSSEAGWEAGDKAALAGGTISASCTIAVAAGATGAFAVAASGPFAAGALGAIGLFLAAKSTYSNREAAHSVLMPYVWSYVDDEAPEAINATNRDDLGAAAMSLISDGQAQQKLMDSKFKAAEQSFNSFWNDYDVGSRAISRISKMSKNQMKRKEVEGMVNVAGRNLVYRQKLLDKALAPSGAAFEFMRRLAHFGNYMQAATVVGKVMQKDLTPLQDLAINVPEVRGVREKLGTISARIIADDAVYQLVEEVLLERA